MQKLYVCARKNEEGELGYNLFTFRFKKKEAIETFMQMHVKTHTWEKAQEAGWKCIKVKIEPHKK